MKWSTASMCCWVAAPTSFICCRSPERWTRFAGMTNWSSLSLKGGAVYSTPTDCPAPLHFGQAFLRAPMLGIKDKASIARGMAEFLSPAEPGDEVSIAQWLKRTGQTEQAIRHFWEPVVLCTLNDSSANCSLRIGAKVFRELFVKSPVGARLGIPTVPLSDLYSGAARRFEALGGTICLRAGVDAISRESDGRWRLATSSGEHISDAVVLALPFEATQKLIATMPPDDRSLQLARDLGGVSSCLLHHGAPVV